MTPALLAVASERVRQDTKWGEQNHPDGTGPAGFGGLAAIYRDRCNEAAKTTRGSPHQTIAPMHIAQGSSVT